MSKQRIEDDEDLSFIDINEGDDYYEDYDNQEYADEYYEDEEVDDYEDDEKSSKSKYFHIAFVIILVLIVGGIIFYAQKWQKGRVITVTEDDLTRNFDIESMDFYVAFDPTQAEGYVDDGELNIIILGDDSINHCQDDTSISAIIAKETGANVTTLAFDGARMTNKYDAYHTDFPQDAYSVFNQALCITTGSDGAYDIMQDQAWNDMEDPTMYYAYWDVLHKVKFKNADVIILNYGMNDYLEKAPILGTEVTLTQPYGLADGLVGSMTLTYKMLKERFPQTQIIVSSPSFMFATDDNGDFRGADTINYGNGTFGEYIAEMAHYAGLMNVTFVDNYIMDDFNPGNYEDCLEDNMIFANEKGRRLIAEHLIKNFYFNR